MDNFCSLSLTDILESALTGKSFPKLTASQGTSLREEPPLLHPSPWKGQTWIQTGVGVGGFPAQLFLTE